MKSHIKVSVSQEGSKKFFKKRFRDLISFEDPEDRGRVLSDVKLVQRLPALAHIH